MNSSSNFSFFFASFAAKFPIFIFGTLFMLVACQSDGETASPTAVSQNPTPLALDTAVPATAPLPADTPTIAPTAIAPVELTAVPTTEIIPPTSTSIPTNTPIPTFPVTSIQLVPVVRNGLVNAVYLTHAGDDRLFVVEQDGRIRIVQNGSLVDTPFLDIDDRVGSEANEQGLLSVAFHPNYAENGRFFVNYTNNNGHTVIARYQVRPDNPNQADPASEVILLTIDQPYENHNGGQIQFGPDGYLYIGMGDGGSQGDPQNNGQNPDTLLGDILRIDVNHEANGLAYTIPPTNPFLNDANYRPEIWAMGFRNPWRFSFDRLTGDLYITDVGQNQWEEVNFQSANSPGGQNYGWNLLEATHCYQIANCDSSGFTLPVHEYSHAEGGCSITGGYVYRGQEFPSLTGNYFFADYCTGFIWSLFSQPDGSWVSNLVAQTGFSISSFGENVSGELYILQHRTGIVYQIQSPTGS